MKTYTIVEIRKYLTSQDSMGDILYNLTEENIDKANLPLRENVEYQAGYHDRQQLVEKDENPYPYNTNSWHKWIDGWQDADWDIDNHNNIK